jgi:glycine/D-amino acid oxidase-like deaminating enzyme
LHALASAEPYWWEAAPPPETPDEPVSPECDAIVVGAGYAGLSAALELARAGRTVQMFDRQRPGEGASSRNGGIASGNLRLSFGDLARTKGLDQAKAMYREGTEARDDLVRFIEEERIDCDFRLTGRFTGAVTPAHYDAQRREADLLNTHLDIGARCVARDAQHKVIASELFHGGILRPDVGGLHPAKFHAGFMSVTTGAGVRVFGNTAVLAIRPDGGGFEVRTDRCAVRARDVVVTTNGYTDRCDPWLRRRLVPVASRMIATEPLDPAVVQSLIPGGRMLGTSRRLHNYFRPSPDGRRILFGGRDRTGDRAPEQAAARLRRELVAIFPQISDVRITHAWAGNVAFNLDHLPRLFLHDGIHYAAGFCGSGVVWARWLGRKAAQRILGDDRYRSTFAGRPPYAIPLYSGKPWFLPAAIAWFALRDRLDMAARE